MNDTTVTFFEAIHCSPAISTVIINHQLCGISVEKASYHASTYSLPFYRYNPFYTSFTSFVSYPCPCPLIFSSLAHPLWHSTQNMSSSWSYSKILFVAFICSFMIFFTVDAFTSHYSEKWIESIGNIMTLSTKNSHTHTHTHTHIHTRTHARTHTHTQKKQQHHACV